MRFIASSMRSFWAAVGICLVVTLFLGVRAEQAVSTVLAAQGEQGLPPLSAAAGLADIARLASKDSLLASVPLAAPDPFFSPEPQPVSAPGIAPPRLETAAAQGSQALEPALRAVLEDGASSSAQISLGAVTSRWLRAGDEFQGWTVVEISARTVTLRSPSGEIRTLP